MRTPSTTTTGGVEHRVPARSGCSTGWSSKLPGTTRTPPRCCAPGAPLHQRRSDQKIFVIRGPHHLPAAETRRPDFGPGAYVDLKHEDLRWFDHWLKGVDTGIMAEPPVQAVRDGRKRVCATSTSGRSLAPQLTAVLPAQPGQRELAGGSGTLTPDPPGTEGPDTSTTTLNTPCPPLGGNNSTWTWMKFAAEPIYSRTDRSAAHGAAR